MILAEWSSPFAGNLRIRALGEGRGMVLEQKAFEGEPSEFVPVASSADSKWVHELLRRAIGETWKPWPYPTDTSEPSSKK